MSDTTQRAGELQDDVVKIILERGDVLAKREIDGAFGEVEADLRYAEARGYDLDSIVFLAHIADAVDGSVAAIPAAYAMDALPDLHFAVALHRGRIPHYKENVKCTLEKIKTLVDRALGLRHLWEPLPCEERVGNVASDESKVFLLCNRKNPGCSSSDRCGLECLKTSDPDYQINFCHGNGGAMALLENLQREISDSIEIIRNNNQSTYDRDNAAKNVCRNIGRLLSDKFKRN